ncbi:MAG: PEGA domain-containing protein, partial [Euryarchaeota archaeon]|nr:PEGA domain-containing protein [Euryarchaeota archaeon]
MVRRIFILWVALLLALPAGATHLGASVPDQGIVAVKSVPGDAQVYLDSKLMGTTPLGGAYMKFAADVGTHTLSVQKDRYVTYTTTITVRDNRITSLEVNLVFSPTPPPTPEPTATPAPT